MITERQLTRATEPGYYRADDTLYLRITETGARNWIQRLVVGGKRRNIGLGNATLIDVKDAKIKAIENRRLVLTGGDPLAAKRKAKTPTFAEAMEKTAAANAARWKESTAYRWRRTLNKNAIPHIGDLRIDKIGRVEVLQLLTPIWADKPTLARKLREHLRTVFSWAQAHGYIELNPAGDMVNGALPTQAAVKSNMRAMTFEDIPDAVQSIRECEANLPSKLCLEFIILTGCRGGEARAAQWSEIDLKAATWTIPASRMKAKRDHVVPLVNAALDVLERAAAWAGKSNLLFPSPAARKVMTDATLLNTLTAAGLRDKTSVHGFRSSFRDWCSHTRQDRELAEMCLAHKIGNAAELAYKRSDLLEARRPIMNAWAQYATAVDRKQRKPELSAVNG